MVITSLALSVIDAGRLRRLSAQLSSPSAQQFSLRLTRTVSTGKRLRRHRIANAHRRRAGRDGAKPLEPRARRRRRGERQQRRGSAGAAAGQRRGSAVFFPGTGKTGAAETPNNAFFENWPLGPCFTPVQGKHGPAEIQNGAFFEN